jgi:hypothetical protein
MRYQKQFVQQKVRVLESLSRLKLTNHRSSIGSHTMIKKDGAERVFKGRQV